MNDDFGSLLLTLMSLYLVIGLRNGPTEGLSETETLEKKKICWRGHMIQLQAD